MHRDYTSSYLVPEVRDVQVPWSLSNLDDLYGATRILGAITTGSADTGHGQCKEENKSTHFGGIMRNQVQPIINIDNKERVIKPR